MALFLQFSYKTFTVHRDVSLKRKLFGKIDRKSERVIQLEEFLPGEDRLTCLLELIDVLVECFKP